jgi:CheY-like chemotaxis protein
MMNLFTSNVLLVDDEEQFLDMLSQRLEVRGIKVDTVTGGEEAMDKITDKKFDAIVLDLVMPGIDGIETLKPHAHFFPTTTKQPFYRAQPSRVRGLWTELPINTIITR